MFANLDRDQFIQLLHDLGSEDDEEVLTAARDLHARVTVAGVDWDDLLVPEEEADEEDYDDEDDEDVEAAELDDEVDDEEDDDEELAAAGDDDRPVNEAEKAEALALIDKLMERGISQATRDELNEYKSDIAEDDFLAMDLRYLKALHKRLTN